MKLQLHPIPIFSDNYVWCLSNDRLAYVVDPGDAGPVMEYLSAQALELAGILITHHHWDHVNGIAELVNAYPEVDVWGPAKESIPHCSKPVSGGDSVATALGLSLEVIDIPGHTAGHIGYFSPDSGSLPGPLLFCGDTLFSAGCGRLFEGTPEEMFSSLSSIASLSKNLIICCTHEYTSANLAFAQAVNPANEHVAEHVKAVAALRANGKPSLPSSIELELKINPFLRVSDPDIVNQLTKKYGKPPLSDEESFAMLRSWKDNF